jgi:hypothetical protein
VLLGRGGDVLVAELLVLGEVAGDAARARRHRHLLRDAAW